MGSVTLAEMRSLRAFPGPPALLRSWRRPLGPLVSAGLVGAIAVVVFPASAQVPVFAPPAAVDPAVRTDRHSDELPRVASGVGGVWVVVWQVVGAVDIGLGRDVDILWSRSVDEGEHWTAPRPLVESFRDDRAEDRQPALATDGDGTWIVVWTSTRDLGETGRRDRDIHYSVSTDNALTWSRARELNTNAAADWGDDESPDIATDGQGRWVVVWQSGDSLGNTKGGDRDILFATSTDHGRSWSAPGIVDAAARNDTAFDTSPRVAAGAPGTWLVAWSSGSSTEDGAGFQRGVLLARSEDGTASWSPAQSLSGASDDDRPDWGPRLAGNAKGTWICAWSSSDDLGKTIGRDRDVLVVRSNDDGRTWTTRVALNREAGEDSGDDETPELAVDGAGNWVAVWTSWDRRGEARGADADLLVAMSRDDGESWTRPYILNTNANTDHGEDTTPSLATDGSGVWLAAWASTETFGEVLGRDRDVFVATGRFGFELAGPPEP